MQNREKKPCFNCGAPVEIVPAGLSKTKVDAQGKPKPYGAFAPCKECGKTEQIGPQPAKAGGASKDFIVTELKKINERLDGMARVMATLTKKEEEETFDKF